MNKERCLILADHIEKCQHNMCEPNDPEAQTHFQMSKYTFRCGSPACIAGHACALFAKNRRHYDWTMLDKARELLDLSTDDAYALFHPYLDYMQVHHIDQARSRRYRRHTAMARIQPDVAATVLREFVATKQVVWPESLQEYDDDIDG